MFHLLPDSFKGIKQIGVIGWGSQVNELLSFLFLNCWCYCYCFALLLFFPLKVQMPCGSIFGCFYFEL